MTSSVTTHSEGKVARPLRVLVPLIKKDLDQAHDASKRAGMPYYRTAGEKMLEAKPQMTHAEFAPWVKRNFDISYSQAQQYMNYAVAIETSSRTREFSSLNEFKGDIGRSRPTKQTWHDDVKDNIERARREAERIREENLTRQQERDAERKLAMRLIDIGYKVLAKELHPDKGGSRDAMQRLGRVRDRLKQCI
jgi:hypothetical protein